MRISFNSYWLRSGLFSFAQKFSTLLFGVVGFLILVRILTKDDFGTWSLFLIVIGLLEVSKAGFLKNAFISAMQKGDNELYAEVNSASLFLNVASSVVVAVILFFGAEMLSTYWETPVLAPMFRIYAVATLVMIVFSQCEYVQQANFQFNGVFWGYFVRQGVLFLGVVYLLLFKPQMEPLIFLSYVQLFGIFCGSLILLAQTKKYFKFSSNIAFKQVLEQASYGKYVFATNVSAIVFRATDAIMLGSFISTAAVAVYNTAIRISNLIELPSASAADIIFPKSVETMKSKGRRAVRDLYEKSLGTILAIMLPACLFVFIFPEWVIYLLAGNEYMEAVPILQITVVYSIFLACLKQFGTILDSIGRPNVNFYTIAFIALVNFGLNYYMIQAYQVIGAAYATLISYIISLIISQLVLWHYLDVSLLRALKNIGKTYKLVFAHGVRFLKYKSI